MAKRKPGEPLKPGHGVPNLPEDGLSIFPDGSMLRKPRRGGWGYRLVWTAEDGSEAVDDVQGPGYLGATNNQMELMACVEALKDIQKPYMKFDLMKMSKVVVFPDSQYVQNNYQRARFEWNPHWTGKDGQPIENAPEWKQLITELKRLEKLGVRVEFVWRKGHNPLNPHNKAADKLATAAAESAAKSQLRPTSPGRKLTSEPTVRKSVKMHGQEITIRVIGHTLNPLTRTTSYRYEVVDDASEFNGLSDFITSTEVLHRWQTYRVRVNDNTDDARILEVLLVIPGEDEEAEAPPDDLKADA